MSKVSDFTDILVEAKAIADLQEQFKRRSMIYQFELKHEAAAFFKLDPSVVLVMSYPEWDELRTRYKKESGS